MANIKPFKGYRYNLDKISDVSAVVCPPNYNMSDELRDELYSKSDYNSVRIFTGKEYENDTDLDNRFTRANKALRSWISEGVLIREDKPAIYLYEQTVDMYGATYTNKNFITLVEIEELNEGNIKPCEEVHETSLKDYYDTILNTNADTSMISCLYIEREKELLNLMDEISEKEPDFEFNTKDDQSVHEKVWIIEDEKIIESVVDKFKEMPLYITDGQTRYEACLRYRNYMMKKNPNHTGNEPYNYTLVSLMNAHSDGLVIMPFHRELICPRGFKEDYFIAGVQDHFKIEKIIVDSDEIPLIDIVKQQISTTRTETKIGVYSGGDYFYRITLNDKNYIKNELLPSYSSAYCGLDTVVLNKLVLEDLLNINEENYSQRLRMVRSRYEALNDLENKKCDVIFILNPVKTEQIKNVAAEGEKLPHMTISVFPKPAVGTIINVLED